MYEFCREDEDFDDGYSNEFQRYEASFDQCHWAEEDAQNCPCHGCGWALSNLDVWHKCRVHFTGQLHPEEAEYQEEARLWWEEEKKKPVFTTEIVVIGGKKAVVAEDDVCW